MESSGEQLHRFTGMDWCFWRYKVPEHDTRCVYVVGRYPWESFGTLMAFVFSFLLFFFFLPSLSLVSCKAHRGVLYRATCYNGTTGQRTRRFGTGSIVLSSISTGTGLEFAAPLI